MYPQAKFPDEGGGGTLVARPLSHRFWHVFIPSVAIVLGITAGVFLMHDRSNPAITQSNVRPVSAVSVADHVDLNVVRDGDTLSVRWPASLAADHGVLKITDGKHHTTIKLDSADVASGLLTYWPDSSDVSFRIELNSGGRTIFGQAVGFVRDITVPTAIDVATTDAKPSPFDPPRRRRAKTVHPAKMTYNQPQNPLVAPLAYRPQVAVVAEPVQKRGVLGRIPLLRKWRKVPDGFVPPKPVHEVRPLVGGLEASELERPLPIDVKVYVSESGRVKSADLLSSVDGQHEFLASAAVVAARRWNFTPARAAGEKVPGEMILHFRFEPSRN